MTINKYITQGDDGASISVTLLFSDNTPMDLTAAESVTFVMRATGMLTPSVDAEAVIVDAEEGKVRYDLEAEDIDEAGDYEFVFKVVFPEGTITYPTRGPLVLRVLDNLVGGEAEDLESLVSRDEAYRYTGESTSLNKLVRAQILIGAYIDRDLFDEDWVDGLDTADTRRLKQAIAYHATQGEGTESNTALTNLPAGVTSVSQGDISLSFSNPTEGTAEVTIAPMAVRILNKLSWRNNKTIKPNSMFNDNPEDIKWTSANAFYSPIVRSMPSDDQLWEPL